MSAPTTPLVSVLVPAFDDAAHLDEALRSVLAQSIDDLEVVVADDGSTDATPQLAASWAATDPRVRVLRSDVNRGMTENWNAALQHRLVERVDEAQLSQAPDRTVERADAGQDELVRAGDHRREHRDERDPAGIPDRRQQQLGAEAGRRHQGSDREAHREPQGTGTHARTQTPGPANGSSAPR